MMTTTRSRMLRCLGALLGAAALLGGLPAQAEGRPHDDRGHRSRGHDRDCDAGRGHAHGRQLAIYAPRVQPALRRVRGGQRYVAPAYYCERCRTHFASYDGLYAHASRYHGVPTWRVPGVLAQVSFGWTFGF
jgi:hypothetical protein